MLFKRIFVVALFSLFALAGFGQGDQEENLYYLDVSVGYSVALPPLSNGSADPYSLKGTSGGSMSFSFNRKFGEQWGLQLEVLSTSFKVNKSDFLKADGIAPTNPRSISISPYRSTFFGVGGVGFFPLGGFILDIKGSVGLNMVDFAKQTYTIDVNQIASNVEVTSKRAYAPGMLLGGRLRYPLGQSIDVGVKLEYGISYATFTDMTKQLTPIGSTPVNPSIEEIPTTTKTISYVNAGITLGVKF